MKICKKLSSFILAFSLLTNTSYGYSSSFPLNDTSHFITEDTDRNMYVISESAVESLKEEYKYIASVSNDAYGTASLYEIEDGTKGVLVVEDSLASLLDEGNEAIPLAVVLTAVAIDFGLIGVMYGVYATK